MGRLLPIPAGGCLKRPDIVLVFINPTARNISSKKSWKGPRFPFVGTNQVWRVLSNAGLVSGDFSQIRKGDWTVGFARGLERTLKKRKIALTNLCKETKPDGRNPGKEEIERGKKKLFREIGRMRPRAIIAMGLIPFEAIAGKKIKLKESAGKSFPAEILGRQYNVRPCYFPVGRGNPKKAEETLKLILKKLSRR